MAIDSGATETVMAEETLNGVIEITEGAAFKRGVKYEVANAKRESVQRLWIVDEHAEFLHNKRALLHLLDWVCIQDMVDNDLVLALDLSLVVSTKTCSVCSSVVGLRQCGRCRNVYYCSALCQHQAWRTHRAVCNPLL